MEDMHMKCVAVAVAILFAVAQVAMADEIGIDPATVTVLTPEAPCDEVSMVFNRVDNTDVRGFSVTFELSPELTLCEDEFISIREGSYLSGVGLTFYATHDYGGGSYTVDCAILGMPCGATGSGTLFTIDVKGSGGSGTGTITVTTVLVRDCVNMPVPAVPGAPVEIEIQARSRPTGKRKILTTRW